MEPEPSGAKQVRRRGPRSDAIANRQRLAMAAAEVFARLGPGARLEDIAQHAGLGIGTAYRHLGSRDEALHDVLAARIGELIVVADRADLIADPWEAFSWYLTELATNIAADRGVMALMGGQGVSADQVEQLRCLMDPRTAAIVERAKAAGELRDDAAVNDIPMLLVCVDHIAEGTGGVAPDVWRRFLCLALDGLRASRDSATPMPVPPLTDTQFAQVGAAAHAKRGR